MKTSIRKIAPRRKAKDKPFNVKIINKNNFYADEDGMITSGPTYSTDGAGAFDFRSNLLSSVTLEKKGGIMLVPTGLYMEIPRGFKLDISPRSGLAFKHGISIVNSPGLIDEDYRGEIKVILINHDEKDFVINPGDRIAQGAFTKVYRAKWKVTDTLTETARGEGGFGHTGVR